MSYFFRIADIILDQDTLKIPKATADSNSFAIVLELAFAALGAAAFIIIVVAGMKFVLSRGSSDAVAKARNTIVYAAIGLVVSMLSFTIVRFVVRGI